MHLLHSLLSPDFPPQILQNILTPFFFLPNIKKPQTNWAWLYYASIFCDCHKIQSPAVSANSSLEVCFYILSRYNYPINAFHIISQKGKFYIFLMLYSSLTGKTRQTVYRMVHARSSVWYCFFYQTLYASCCICNISMNSELLCSTFWNAAQASKSANCSPGHECE